MVKHGLLAQPIDPARGRKAVRRFGLGTLAYPIATAIGLLSPPVMLLAYGGLATYYMFEQTAILPSPAGRRDRRLTRPRPLSRFSQPRKLSRTVRSGLSTLVSTRQIDCHVPSCSWPPTTGTVMDGAMNAGSTWSRPWPGEPCRCRHRPSGAAVRPAR